MRQLEKKTHLEGAVLSALLRLSLSFFVLAQSVQAARLVDVDLLVLLAALDQLVVDSHTLAAFTEK